MLLSTAFINSAVGQTVPGILPGAALLRIRGEKTEATVGGGLHGKVVAVVVSVLSVLCLG